MRKLATGIVMAVIVSLLIEFVVSRSKPMYEVALSVMPREIRQTYLDYVLDVRYGYFRSYIHKCNTLDILITKIKRDGQLDFTDGKLFIPLLSGGMDGEEEPIPQLAAYALLLINSRSSYQEIFVRYKNDRLTIDAFRRKFAQLKQTDPARYPDIAKTLEEVGGLPTGFLGPL